ncbi:glycerate kinase [Persicobacter sp. CCB-QB2]|uniref:glycerate kinase n=1 Tax=Persicobacter sp. CCB-QB2 TaxID=1561025 RepID=UPI0006A95339|nr:glycerate kinase [Persicobacter sp. CCB-QB2]
MKILIAPDAFKGSLSAPEVVQIIQDALADFSNRIQSFAFPLADGGEGFVDCLKKDSSRIMDVKTSDPLGRPISAQYILNEDTAIIEMASASGLPLLREEEFNPCLSSTYGTGVMIRQAIAKGIRKFIIGIGGSATNDAGTGLLQALGFEFFDVQGNILGTGGQILSRIHCVSEQNLLPELKNCHFQIACDVQNPFIGPEGAAFIYAPQKGANAQMVEQLDQGLRNFAHVIARHNGKEIQKIAGAGAGGGISGGLWALLNGKLKSGFDIICEAKNIDQLLPKVDLILTGEGKLDRQSLEGKVLKGLYQRALPYQIPIIAFAGKVEADILSDLKIKKIRAYEISIEGQSLAEAMAPKQAMINLRNAVLEWIGQYGQ